MIEIVIVIVIVNCKLWLWAAIKIKVAPVCSPLGKESCLSLTPLPLLPAACLAQAQTPSKNGHWPRRKLMAKEEKRGGVYFFLQGEWIELAYRGIWWTRGLGRRLNHLARTRNCTARTGEEKGEQRRWVGEELYLFSEQNIFDQFNWPEQLFVFGLNYFCLLSFSL